MGKTFLHKMLLCILMVSPNSIYSQVINPDKWASWTACIVLVMLVLLPVLNAVSLWIRSCFMMLGGKKAFSFLKCFCYMVFYSFKCYFSSTEGIMVVLKYKHCHLFLKLWKTLHLVIKWTAWVSIVLFSLSHLINIQGGIMNNLYLSGKDKT